MFVRMHVYLYTLICSIYVCVSDAIKIGIFIVSMHEQMPYSVIFHINFVAAYFEILYVDRYYLDKHISVQRVLELYFVWN